MIRIVEITPSVMGELPLSGRPCVIVRLAGCALRCVYCDTPGALDRFAPGSREMAVERVVERATSMGPRTILLTGGEPMEQPEAPDLIGRLLGAGMRVVLETSGACDLAPLAGHRDVHGDRLVQVVDVKCPGSGETGTFLPGNLPLLSASDRLKFVVSGRDDYDWSLEFLAANGMRTRERERQAESVRTEASAAGRGTGRGPPGILISPVHGTVNARDVAAWIIEDGLDADLNLQVHKYIGMP